MAGEYEHIKGKGNRFSSTNQPPNRGRKPSAYKAVLALIGQEGRKTLSKEDYFKIIQHLMEQPVDELKKLAEDDRTPIWIVNTIRAILADAKAGRLITVNSLFDRIFGKAVQPTTTKGEVELKGSIPIKAWLEHQMEQQDD